MIKIELISKEIPIIITMIKLRKEWTTLANPQTQHHIDKKEVHKEKDNDFKGTFMSVMLLGGFLILSWVGVWILYLIR